MNKYKFGIRTEGTEEKFAEYILNCANQFEKFTFVEVGFAGGVTAKAIRDLLNDNYKKPWSIVSVDLSSAYDKEKATIYKNFEQEQLTVVHDIDSKNITPKEKTNTLYLKDSAEFLKENIAQNSIEFCFIDACHCIDHVIGDFLAIEDKIKQGGIVAFHDVGEIEQGTDHQHDGRYIAVRQAINELGLWNNSRNGWNFIEEIEGDRVNGGEGNNIGIFKKL